MSSKPMRLIGTWLFLSLTMSLTGCAATNVISPCAWVKVITVSKDDALTAQTAREILAHNEKVEEICR